MFAEPLRDDNTRWQWAMWALPINQVGQLPSLLAGLQNDQGYEIQQVYFGMVSPTGSQIIAGPQEPQVMPCHVVLGRRLISLEEYQKNHAKPTESQKES